MGNGSQCGKQAEVTTEEVRQRSKTSNDDSEKTRTDIDKRERAIAYEKNRQRRHAES